MSKRLVFGPVPSRRLGRSLGIDLVPFKTCSYDCVYCQLGRTTDLTVSPREFVDADEVIRQVEAHLHQGAAPDVITLSGSGEPTLYSATGKIIRAIKKMTSIPVVALTNGSLLSRPEVRQALALADVVIPNLDAGDSETWQAVDRPHPELDFETMVQGLMDMADEFAGRLRLEVFLVNGINATEAAVKKIAAIADHIPRARVQLNTVARPPAEDFAIRVPAERLAEFAALFTPPAEVIADFRTHAPTSPVAATELDDILEMLARRPCTREDVAAGLGVNPIEAIKAIEFLLGQDRIVVSRQGDRIYYLPKAAAKK